MVNVEDNLGLISFTINKYFPTLRFNEDVWQEGAIGLIKAVRDFNTDAGIKFSTYAVSKIYGQIKVYCSRGRTLVRLLRKDEEAVSKIKGAMNKWGYDEKVVAEKTGLKLELVAELMQNVILPPNNLEFAFNNDTTIADTIADNHDDYEDVLNSIYIKELLKDCTEKERKVISMYYLEGMSQMEIAKALNTAQVNISRLISRALKKARGGQDLPKPIKEIHCYTIDGRYVGTFPRIKDAAESLQIHPSHISDCCRGRIKKTGGYVFTKEIRDGSRKAI